MLTAKISDLSDQMFISFLSQIGEPIMNGLSAQQLMEIKEEQKDNPEAIKELFQQCNYKVRIMIYSKCMRVYSITKLWSRPPKTLTKGMEARLGTDTRL